MQNILIIDDNLEILSANEAHLADGGFCVTAVDTGIKAITALNEKRYDCIVLDVLLPDLDGFAICKAARTVTDTPIIFLTCMDDLDDKLKGLMSGGDDYMTKPYSLIELSARIRAQLRRGKIIGRREPCGFYIDADNRMIHAAGKNIFLSEKEFDLFMLFHENPMTYISKENIFERVWKSAKTNPDTVAVHILKLRRKIDEQTIGSIETNYRRGYRFVPFVTENDGT